MKQEFHVESDHILLKLKEKISDSNKNSNMSLSCFYVINFESPAYPCGT